MADNIDIFINGRSNFSPVAAGTVGGLRQINDALHHTQGEIKSFNAIMELAFGFHVGRFFFEKIHEGLSLFIEGLNSGGLEAGMDKLLGIKTAAEKTAAAMDKLSQVTKPMATGISNLEKTINPSANKFPFLGSRGKELTDAFAAQEEVEKQVYFGQLKPKLDKRDELQKKIDEYHKAHRDQGATYAEEYPHRRNVSALNALNEEIKPLVNAFNRKVEEREFYQDIFTKSNDAAKFVTGKVSGFLGDKTFQGWKSYFEAASSGPLGKYGRDLLSGNWGGAIGSLIGQIPGGSVFNKIDRDNQTKYATPFDKAEEELKRLASAAGSLTPEQKKFAALGIMQRFASASGLMDKRETPGLAGTDQRFLTRGSGPLHTPELTALEKILASQKDLVKAAQDAATLLGDIKKKFGPIGVVDGI